MPRSSYCFRTVIETLELPINEEMQEMFDLFDWFEHSGHGRFISECMPRLRDLIREAMDEKEPLAQYRAWVSARVKNVGYNVLLPEERDFIRVRDFHLRVYDQTFENVLCSKLGDTAPEMLEILERIGAHQTRDLLFRVMELVGSPYPTNLTKRRRIVNKLGGTAKYLSDFEAEIEDLSNTYCKQDESCLTLAAEAAVAAYRRTGMSIPPLLEQQAGR
jgi:hypothetical protein